jgi:SAM-dependent methyltransferase
MIGSFLKSITKTFKNMSTTGWIVIFLVILLLFNGIIKQRWESKHKGIEGFETKKSFAFHEGVVDIYDDFYAGIYDQLVFNTVLNDYEVGAIIQNTNPTQESIILDVGSGTGHDVSTLTDKGFQVTGLDISPSMIHKAKEMYPSLNFVRGDALNASQFQGQTFTHVLCLYFTIYYMEDKMRFFSNAMNWLKPGGYLVVHLVDKDMFDPILPPANPLVLLTPQRYSKERITKSKVTFNNFKYDANFDIPEGQEKATFVEKMHFHDGTKRKNEHKMYMPPLDDMVQLAQDAGFLVHAKIDLIKAGYEYQYLYVFTRPT